MSREKVNTLARLAPVPTSYPVPSAPAKKTKEPSLNRLWTQYV